ncbi:hypothetical protein ABT173_09610 [Streptomyces sp. NPDC001795]|uniref:hypothetical protein n=1 Tax=Streptomyces sp. NPDC001795 TaxID=3154525 RepID=UPI003328CB4E
MPTASAGAEPRLDSVEIKVTFSDAGAADAIRTLAPDHGGARRLVYFCEALARSRAPGELPLTDAGVILRLRDGGGRGGDVTARLRPCRRSRLTERWLGFRQQGPDSFGLTGDWSGEHRTLSASFTTDCGSGAVEAVASGAQPPCWALSERQRAFLSDCADVVVASGPLEVLGPVHSVRWDGVRIDHHEVTVESWTLPGPRPLHWLEVSERVAPQGAEVVQASLRALLRRQGLEPGPGEDPKTRQVLETLARGARSR